MVNEKLRDDLTDQLCRAILSLDTMEECYQFFEDIGYLAYAENTIIRCTVFKRCRHIHSFIIINVHRLYNLFKDAFGSFSVHT